MKSIFALPMVLLALCLNIALGALATLYIGESAVSVIGLVGGFIIGYKFMEYIWK